MSSSHGRPQERRRRVHSYAYGDSQPKRSDRWKQNLLRAMEDPAQVVETYDDVVILIDVYPKAKHHYLVLPKHENLQTLEDLNKGHVTLLESMLEKGQRLVDKIRGQNDTAPFQLGFHAVPSLDRLHMHVISRDFDSPSMKRPKHWHSFTTARFIPATEVLQKLKERGRIRIDRQYYDDILMEPLTCHVCKKRYPDMERLKQHFRQHDWKDV